LFAFRGAEKCSAPAVLIVFGRWLCGLWPTECENSHKVAIKHYPAIIITKSTRAEQTELIKQTQTPPARVATTRLLAGDCSLPSGIGVEKANT